jgi:hypothetical protein
MDQPFDFGVVQALDDAPAGAGRLHAERASCSLDHVFGLVVGEVVLAPEPAGGARDMIDRPSQEAVGSCRDCDSLADCMIGIR